VPVRPSLQIETLLWIILQHYAKEMHSAARRPSRSPLRESQKKGGGPGLIPGPPREQSDKQRLERIDR
jgi:hypothetical protein